MPNELQKVTRLVAIQVCEVCGAQRIGKAAPRWPRGATVCPKCSDIAWRAIDLGTDRLVPRAAS